jgi:hypothetical protein
MVNCPYCDFTIDNYDVLGKHILQNHSQTIVQSWPDHHRKRLFDNRITTEHFTVPSGKENIQYTACFACQECVHNYSVDLNRGQFQTVHEPCNKKFNAIQDMFVYDKNAVAQQLAAKKVVSAGVVRTAAGKQIKCAYCDYTGGGEAYKINRHQDTCKHNPKNIEKMATQTVTEYKCPHCEYTSPYKCNANRHIMNCKKTTDQQMSVVTVMPTVAAPVVTPTVVPDAPAASELQAKLDQALAEIERQRKAYEKLDKRYDNLDEDYMKEQTDNESLKNRNDKMLNICECIWSGITQADDDFKHKLKSVFGASVLYELEKIVTDSESEESDV